jgi:hypothetical protein
MFAVPKIPAVRAVLIVLALCGLPACSPDEDDEERFVSRVRHVPPRQIVSRGQPTETRPEEMRVLPRNGAEVTMGRWFRARQTTPEQRERIAQLESLGYVAGSHPPTDNPIISRHDRERAQPGYNFFTSGHAPEALLVDMQGRLLHRWTFSSTQAFPERGMFPDDHYFRRAHLYENGDLLAIFEGHGIIKIDRDSRLLWKNENGAHHDLQVLPNGDIYVLSRKGRVIPRIDEQQPVLEDFISILDSSGVEQRRVSVLAALERSSFASLLESSQVRHGDLLHTNTLEVLDGRFVDHAPWLAAGNLLTSFLTVDAVAVIDMEREQVVQAWMGSFKAQHDPQLLDNGHMLLFDNRGGDRFSRVFEFDPLTNAIHWEYRGTTEQPFYTRTCGTAQRLPNGNTLITESDYGRAFEVTAHHEVVWEFHNPHRAGEQREFVAALLEMVRLPADFPLGWARYRP